VLQGRMSAVGPRPHAVAHNEQYRKLIKGYMLRHKVKPGITGWAQVNGLRGETETLDKMRARVQYDIDYMRNWSLVFDLMIIAKTVAVVWRDQNAYCQATPLAGVPHVHAAPTGRSRLARDNAHGESLAFPLQPAPTRVARNAPRNHPPFVLSASYTPCFFVVFFLRMAQKLLKLNVARARNGFPSSSLAQGPIALFSLMKPTGGDKK
jgi:hypothetical protein